MKILKQILAYLIWTVLSILLGIGYMYLIIGPIKEPTTTLSYLLKIFYSYGIVYVGVSGGLVIALLYILSDIFYLKKKLTNNVKSTGIRFLVLLGIAIVVGVTHYILEKVVDVI